MRFSKNYGDGDHQYFNLKELYSHIIELPEFARIINCHIYFPYVCKGNTDFMLFWKEGCENIIDSYTGYLNKYELLTEVRDFVIKNKCNMGEEYCVANHQIEYDVSYIPYSEYINLTNKIESLQNEIKELKKYLVLKNILKKQKKVIVILICFKL